MFRASAQRFLGWWILVFFANAALMTIELVTGRVLAPYLGVSITSWASIISVVMVAMAIGSALGAKAVDRQATAWSVPSVLVLAAVYTVCLPAIAKGFGPWVVTQSWSTFTSSFTLAMATLAIPAGALAFLYPLVAEQVRTEEGEAGLLIGKLSAASALGSIAGVVLSGFLWIMWFSLPVILYSVTVGLLLLVALASVFLRVSKQAVNQETQNTTSVAIHWRWKLGACVLGASLMAVELVASRILAPFLGVSIFTWTAIITVMLVGVSVGNILGGVYADRLGSNRTIGHVFVWAAWSVAYTLIASSTLGSAVAHLTLPLIARIILFAVFAFLPAAVLFGVVSPVLVVTATDAKHRLGEVAGVLSAWNTLGGLLGSVGSGFVLIALLGTRWVLALVAGLLVFAAVVTGIAFVRSLIWKQLAAVAVVIATLVVLPSTCIKETQYFCIRIQNQQAVEQGETTQALQLDHLVHSFVDLKHPERISGYSYERIYAHLLAYKATTSTSFSSYSIGGGGFVFPRFILAAYPHATSTVAEIDPGVTAFNYEQLGLVTSSRLRVFSGDARQYLLGASEGETYDLVFGDAFNDLSVPYHLTTREFHQLVKSHMNADGVYAMNTIDDTRHGLFLAAMIRTLREVWTNVYVLPGAQGLSDGRNTIVLLASDEPLDLQRWESVISPAAQPNEMASSTYQRFVKPLTEKEVEEFLSTRSTPSLTDDFAPTDRYLAPLFSEAY